MIELYKHQDEFLYSNARHTGLVAGYGAGKTFSGVLKTVSKKLEYPSYNVAYYLPTYPLIRDVAIPEFQTRLSSLNIPYQINKSDKDITTPLGKIILRSTDNPELIVGYNVAYSLIDEADVLPKDKMQKIFKKVLARNRANIGKENQLDFVSTPEGFKFLYDFFVINDAEYKHLITAKTTDNKSISDAYIQSLLDSYSKNELDAYLNGLFVPLTSGRVYRSFDRKLNHTNQEINESDVLHIGMDFNITKMAAVVYVISNGMPLALDELVDVYDTPTMVKLIKDKFPKNRCVIYPDASGDNRKTVGISDIQYLKQARFMVKYAKTNPFVKDRVNTLNRLILNNHNQRLLKVNTHKCPRLTEAFEKIIYDKNGVPDKKTGLDHVTDAAGYPIYIIKNNLKTKLAA